MQPSTVGQEPANPFGFVSQFGSFVLNSSRLNPDVLSTCLSNCLYFDANRKPVMVSASLSLTTKGAAFSITSAINQFNTAIRFHCERIPLGFASVRVDSEESYGCKDDVNGVLDDSEGVPTNAGASNSLKRVLILMSDTGGGHRASAEAIKAVFAEEFGDEYQVSVTDLWTDHTPWPFNQLPKSYNFLVKHGSLWKMTYYATAPRVIHRTNFAATSAFIARFHKLVTRIYCPSEDVAKRAVRAGIQRPQIKVYGLPVRPSFVKPVPPKILVICGRNKKLTSKLQSINWKIPVEVKGFVTKMEDCMGACDCIITKAGSGTIAEAMIRGLPIILNDYIAGQPIILHHSPMDTTQPHTAPAPDLILLPKSERKKRRKIKFLRCNSFRAEARSEDLTIGSG